MGKKGRLYLKFIVAVAIVAALLFAYSTFASAAIATPPIVNTNGTAVNGAFIANAHKEGDAL